MALTRLFFDILQWATRLRQGATVRQGGRESGECRVQSGENPLCAALSASLSAIVLTTAEA